MKNSKVKVEKRKFNKKKILIIIFSIFTGILLFVGLGIGIYYWTTDSAGTVNIELGEYSDEYEMKYNLTGSRQDATNTKKQVTKMTNSQLTLYNRLFDSVNLYDDLINVAYINNHINENIKVNDALYNAFKTINDNKSREIFFGPIFEYNDKIYSLDNDDEVKKIDYNYNSEMYNYLTSIYKFKNDSNAINIELLDDFVIRLNVHEAYINLLKENNSKRYIDFGYLKNAFIVDSVANHLSERGFREGYLMSSDGYLRVFNNKISRDYDIYDYDKADINIANITVVGKSVVNINKFRNKRYIYSDGRVINNYINPKALGSDLTANTIVCYSSLSCSEMLLKMEGLMYTAISNYSSLSTNGINTIYLDGENIKYNDSSLVFNMILVNDKYEYKKVAL